MFNLAVIYRLENNLIKKLTHPLQAYMRKEWKIHFPSPQEALCPPTSHVCTHSRLSTQLLGRDSWKPLVRVDSWIPGDSQPRALASGAPGRSWQPSWAWREKTLKLATLKWAVLAWPMSRNEDWKPSEISSQLDQWGRNPPLIIDPLILNTSLGVELEANSFFFFFWSSHGVCGILVPWPGIEPVPPAVEVQSLNWRRKQKRLHLEGRTLSWAGLWTLSYAQYLWKRHSNWKTRSPGWKSPRARTWTLRHLKEYPNYLCNWIES